MSGYDNAAYLVAVNFLLMLLIFLLLTLFFFSAWFLWSMARLRASRSESLIYAGLLGASQLVLTEILLGMAGLLTLPYLLGLNLLISLAVAAWSWARNDAGSALRDAWAAGSGEAAPADGIYLSNLVLLGLAAVLLIWVTTASWLLPPRGIDDLTYHLPPLYEYAQTGRLRLLPVELRAGFAMPLGGDFLFLWPLVFFGADTWIDLVQFGVALFGVAVVYGLARTFDVARRDALFAGLLFLLTPVVIGQSASNYVDIIVAVSHLVLLFAAVRYWQTGLLCHLMLAGLATGFALGVKYHMLIAVASVQPLLWLRFFRDGRVASAAKNYAWYWLAALPLPAYWYIRNLIVTGFPLYPFDLTLTGLQDVGGSQSFDRGPVGEPLGSALWAFTDDPAKFIAYLIQDPGLGSLNGGFGLMFWGLGLPALIYVSAMALRAAARRDFFPLLFWLQAFVLFGVVLSQIDITRLRFNMRLMLVLVPLAMLALSMTLPRLRRSLPGATMAIGAAGVLAATLAGVQLVSYALPSFQFRDAVIDRVTDRYTSDYRYYARSAGDLPALAAAWDPLDFLTAPDNGMNVYMAAAWPIYFTTPLFGENLQNRVLSLDRTFSEEPDAVVFHPVGSGLPLFSVGQQFMPNMIAVGGRYELIGPGGATQLWVRSDRLADEHTRQRLLDYYSRRFADEIDALRTTASRLPPEGVLVASSQLGPALKYLSMTGELRIPVHLTPDNLMQSTVQRLRSPVVITIGKPLAGARSRVMSATQAMGSRVEFYRNDMTR